MNDEGIVKAITANLVLAVILSKLKQQDKARLFTCHAIRLIAANRAACERWMEQRKARQSG
jgi:hypothetical protein